ncbi:MAG TPA: hypothetical protein VNT60_10405 [Deinococcales bacterium]|nr:hypothetical protein [Deinococcales bacterium]
MAEDFTPHGYLDLPGHTRNLTPKGVLRSHRFGFRWHYPTYAGGYGSRREAYRAGLSLSVGGERDPKRSCPHHTKNLHRHELTGEGWSGTAEFHPVGDDVLRASLSLGGAGTVRVAAHLEYRRVVSALGEWGESGLVGRAKGERLVLQSFEDGDAFVLAASLPASDMGATPHEATAETWAREAASFPEGGLAHSLGRRGDTVELRGALGFELDLSQGPAGLDLFLARGRTLAEAEERLAAAMASAHADRARRLAEDEAFLAAAPRLSGDWPDHWRRGMHYDLDTLRMMVRTPVGRYRHAWDAMQIQAPRVVLAETAMDMLALAYAEPARAKEAFLGTLLDAFGPQVPCSREDGTLNMLAADGSECGTGPQWGYPLLAAETLHALLPEREWLALTYERLALFLRWWLAERNTGGGWLGFACSWESGQDDSPRFGEQPLGGGHPVRHVRPVDLHASVAHGALTLERFARELGREGEAGEWAATAKRYRALTDGLFSGERYADYDARAGSFTSVLDVMQLAPLALGVAREERLPAARQAAAATDEDSHVWPMFAWTAVLAAENGGLHEHAAATVYASADRAYRFWDARELSDDRTLPGVANEYWPKHGRCGGEGYGWGAFHVHLIIRHLVGYAPTRDGLVLRPNLPRQWREAGREYRLDLTHHGRATAINLAPLDGGRVRVRAGTLELDIAWGESVTITDQEAWGTA